MSDYIQGEHFCKFFAFTTKAEFEPIFVDGQVLYRRVEYLISGCNCGKAARAKTQDISDD